MRLEILVPCRMIENAMVKQLLLVPHVAIKTVQTLLMQMVDLSFWFKMPQNLVHVHHMLWLDLVQVNELLAFLNRSLVEVWALVESSWICGVLLPYYVIVQLQLLQPTH